MTSLRRILVCCLLALSTALVAQDQTTPGSPATPPAAPAPATPPLPSPPSSAPESSSPAPPPANPAAPAETPLPPVQRGSFRVAADRSVIADGVVQFIGKVTVQTSDVTINAAEVTYTRDTERLVARGNVSIHAQDGTTYWGNELEYNLNTRQWEFLDWSVEFTPNYLGGPFIAPVYVNGRELSGLSNFVRGRNSTVTSCNLPVPHYYLISKRIEVYPGDKIIAWNSYLYVLGHRVLYLPWFFLSLQQKHSPIVPEAGRNDFEGYYLRLLYQYVFNRNELGGVRLDLTEKRGIGLGVDHFYTAGNNYGEAFVYGREDLSEYVTRLDHHSNLPDNILFDLHADVRKNSEFTEQTTTITDLNPRFQLQTAHSNTMLNLTRQLIVGNGVTTSDNLTGLFSYSNNTQGSSILLNEEFSSFPRIDSTTGASTADQQLWDRLQMVRHEGFGDLKLNVDHHNVLSPSTAGSSSFFSGLQRLPELALVSTSQQLHFLQALPSTYTLGFGEFDEQSGATQNKLGRFQFNWDGGIPAIKLGKTTISPRANILQTMYTDADKTAQYKFGVNTNMMTTLGPFQNTATYAKQDSHGFSPFLFDKAYPFETVTENMAYRTTPVTLNLTTGRDLQNNSWQDLTFRADAQLSKQWRTSQTTGYDLNNSVWRDLVSEFRWRSDPRVSTILTSRYDFQEGQLRRVSSQVDWVISSKWRVNWIGDYDGLTKQLTANEFLITRDLHCWDVSIYISKQRSYSYLLFRLKALDLPLPSFGIGRGGQILDTSQGTL